MDIRVATVLAAEKVAKTKKLLKLTVDTGIDRREIVSGIAEHFAPEELVGRQVLVLVNLAPRTPQGHRVAGHDSDGGGCRRQAAASATRCRRDERCGSGVAAGAVEKRT